MFVSVITENLFFFLKIFISPLYGNDEKFLEMTFFFLTHATINSINRYYVEDVTIILGCIDFYLCFDLTKILKFIMIK